MISVFPDLFVFQLLSPFILRITLSAVILFWSIKEFKKKNPDIKQRIVTLIKAICGLSLLLGLYTQVSALIVFAYLAVQLFFKFKSKSLFSDGINYYFILLMIALSLLFTGPGVFAFDLPL